MKPIPELTEKQTKRFWAKVDIQGPDDCWNWMGGLRKYSGYGIVRFNNGKFVAHRVANFLATGTDPGELLVCHTCDHPQCCNPAHLWRGTDLDNARDREKKGRAQKLPIGTLNPMAKLNDIQVLEICYRVQCGEDRNKVAEMYGVTRININCIIKGKTWKHVPRPTILLPCHSTRAG